MGEVGAAAIVKINRGETSGASILPVLPFFCVSIILVWLRFLFDLDWGGVDDLNPARCIQMNWFIRWSSL